MRNRYECRQSRFRREQIVVARIGPVLENVVANRKQMALLVVEKSILHLRELGGLQRHSFDCDNTSLRAVACGGNVLPQF